MGFIDGPTEGDKQRNLPIKHDSSRDRSRHTNRPVEDLGRQMISQP